MPRGPSRVVFVCGFADCVRGRSSSISGIRFGGSEQGVRGFEAGPQRFKITLPFLTLFAPIEPKTTCNKEQRSAPEPRRFQA